MGVTDESLVVEGHKVCKLICVGLNKKGAKQSNKFYNMYEQDDGTFIAEWGRVDSTSSQKSYPMSKWESTIKSKKKKDYKEVTHLFAETGPETTPTTMADISDQVVKQLMDKLQRYANKSIEQNYTVSSRSVTQAQIDEAQRALDGVADLAVVGNDIERLNDQFIELFHIIPRKMKNVQDHLFEGKKITQAKLSDIQKAIGNEQDTLDVMAGQVLINDETDDTTEEEKSQRDLLTMLGLEVYEGTKEDYEYVKEKMGPNANQVKKVYMIKHLATQRKFDAHVEQAKDKHTRHFFHGSRNQNWLNIMSTGLMIRPTGAIHTGSMFGDGIYFADKAQKSIGYSSMRGSYWTGGNDNEGYIAMFHVHTGNWKKIKHHTRDCYSLSKNVLDKEGYDSVYAQGGADLRNNEYIVYDSAQCTISHLVQLG